MILLKSLLIEAGVISDITPKDIYNLYYIDYILQTSPTVIQSQFGQETVTHYLSNIKNKYVKLFKEIAYKQLVKYAERNRVDSDFKRTLISPTMSCDNIHALMQKTFRSDMKRRNDVWNHVTEYLLKLSNAITFKDIIWSINALNMAIHNTGAAIITDTNKIINATQLIAAFDTIHKIKHGGQWNLISKYLDKDVRELSDF
jgi:hypothetical protein